MRSTHNLKIIFLVVYQVNQLICRNHEEDFFQILCVSQKVRTLIKKSCLALLHIQILKIESTLHLCPNTLVWFNFWIGQKHFWTYRRMGHVCAVCHSRAKCFHEDWSRIWISLKINKSNIVFSHHHKHNLNFCIIVLGIIL